MMATALIGCAPAGEAQKSGSSKSASYMAVLPADTEADKIRKAARVVPSPRQLRWQQLELTAFFHFGVNTFTGREWGDGKEDPKIFNPTALDADQWVRVAKEGGIKQVILTAKHHDGFCLWPTATTKHSVASSPWKEGKGDVVRDVAEACRRNGVGFGVYLSPWDRNAPMYGTDDYNDFFVQQLTELLTNYGKVDEVWFDGANGEGPNGKKQVYDFDRWYALIRKLQPEAVIAIMGPDVRWVGTESGYGRETEWSVLPVDERLQERIEAGSQKDVTFKPLGDMMENDLGSREKIRAAKGLVWYPAETDVSIRPGWFYHAKEDDKVKSPKELVNIYYASVGRNGVLLLNLPPDRRGLIHEQDAKNLSEWKRLLDQTFANNLLKSATVQGTGGKGSRALLDNQFETFWVGQRGDTTASIEFVLQQPAEFDVLMLQEHIATGQRIERFVLEYFSGGEWKKVAEGTTVGYKRLLRFDPVRAGRVRLRILSSRTEPTLSEIGLYKQVIPSL